ncbi:MAG: ATP-dependent metalloprotease, partial [Thermoleophilia bacterium]|nr:ATP-dependent metalloprotease [Thermoleophilia bacterium]
YSDGVAQEIDREIQRIIDEAHATARLVLEEHRDELERMADILVIHENMDAEQLERLLRGEDPTTVFEETAAAIAAESAAAEAEDAAEAEAEQVEKRSPGTGQLRPGFSTE